MATRNPKEPEAIHQPVTRSELEVALSVTDPPRKRGRYKAELGQTGIPGAEQIAERIASLGSQVYQEIPYGHGLELLLLGGIGTTAAYNLIAHKDPSDAILFALACIIGFELTALHVQKRDTMVESSGDRLQTLLNLLPDRLKKMLTTSEKGRRAQQVSTMVFVAELLATGVNGVNALMENIERAADIVPNAQWLQFLPKAIPTLLALMSLQRARLIIPQR